MSNYVRTSAIPWTDRVCEEFEKQTGAKLLYEPPRPGERESTTEIQFYTRGFEFEKQMMFSDEFIESGNEDVAVSILVREWRPPTSESAS